MKRKLKNLCIRFLFWLLDIPEPREIEKKHMEKWLADNYSDMGFQAYIQTRGKVFLRELAGGSGLAEFPRDDYIRKIGQRFELLRFADLCKKMHEKRLNEHRLLQK